MATLSSSSTLANGSRAVNINGVLTDVSHGLNAPTDTLDWADFSVGREEKSVKQMLDELINRRRGVGYRIRFDAEAKDLFVEAFSFTEFPIALSSGVTLGRNPNQYLFDFEQVVDIDEATVSRVGTQR